MQEILLNGLFTNKRMSSQGKVTIGKYSAENTNAIRAQAESLDGSSMTSVEYSEPNIEVISYRCEKDLPGAEDCGIDQDTLVLRFRGVSIPVANTLRRLILAEVPVMAFDSVVIEENEGVVFDESLSHRIGLVPIHCPPEKFELIKDITMYDAPQASPVHFLKFTLNIKAEEDMTTVYSGDLKWQPLPSQEDLLSFDIKPVNLRIPLCKLAKGRRLRLTAYAVKGFGLNHAKWSPVSCSTYKLRPHVAINPAAPRLSKTDAKAVAKSCPVGVFDIENSGDLSVVNASACTGCRECIRAVDDGCEAPVIVSRLKEDLIFTVESVGQISALKIISTALRNFSKHCQYLGEAVQRSVVSK